MQQDNPNNNVVSQLSPDFVKKMVKIQSELKAPKTQYNKFGKFHYRSAEDILEGLKPHLSTAGFMLYLTDSIVDDASGSEKYVCATAVVTDGEHYIKVTAYAREASSKSGMDSSQITGSASTYARKYALNGLFLIDDTKDADSMDNTSQKAETTSAPPSSSRQSGSNSKKDDDNDMFSLAISYIKNPANKNKKMKMDAFDAVVKRAEDKGTPFTEGQKNGLLKFVG